jgi:N-acetylglucosaminyldiphosphoundecaprenol N-acetyl-beta-D-mannosaminyltransferase
MDHEDILNRIEATKPDILLVAFGSPKQEKWIAMHRSRLRVPVCIGVGGSFEFLSGRFRRAPVWMQQGGFEWLYRMLQEPSRLARRYFNNLVGLLRYLPAQLVWTAFQLKPRTKCQISTETTGHARVLRVNGNLAGSVLIQIESDVRSAIHSGLHVVLDLSHTTYIGADGLGSLIRAMNLACRWRRELWLAGVCPGLDRVIHAAQRRPVFRMASKVAEALRRIEPDHIPGPNSEGDATLICIRGQFVPVYAHEMAELYRQVQMVMKRRLIVDARSAAALDI